MQTIRYLHDIIEKKLSSKMVFVTGPRQSGKTTLSKGIFPRQPDADKLYLNWDFNDDRETILRG